jgi:SAM-dependent methyltransferase
VNPADRAAYVERYERRLAQHGRSPQALGWGRPGREPIRFAVMAEVIEAVGAESVLDVGCGFADLYDHLRERGWTGRYQGIDIVPGLLTEARRRTPGRSVEEADVASYRPGESGVFDVAVASGVFNARLEAQDNRQHIERSVGRMWELSRQAICVDFMSTHVDFQHPDAWHTDPAWALALARHHSRRFTLRHDYLPYEFALAVYHDDTPADSVFGAP